MQDLAAVHGMGWFTMSKRLSEMTLEELWQLFPIYLTAHDDRWGTWYHEEYQRLYALLRSEERRVGKEC